ncbi:DUF3189 family protein [Desmospora activa]|uniref:Uncharacterized protein DUF3189 n=1 Tax=Desmospora activa DSM 45169 TaxID=1121389 RepID=A0A2T4Z9W9_9BACL|nr:DUF3189 family protein [Desmospora activa]PTM58665.1 uncharacterized protein DUF3189 [Desmospora activa DSM 45169]
MTKRLIYHCYGSAHSSVVAAAIHLGRLPTERLPTKEEVLHLPDFDRARSEEIGTLFFKGEDQRGTMVYTVGFGHHWEAGVRALRSMLEIHGAEGFHLVRALDSITWLTKVGGSLSRHYGWPAVGRPLAAWGIRRSYPKLLALVDGVKRDLYGDGL